ncbi:MAG: sigma-70 family RNA polymerase sigma factor [Verrucomicrobiales bacterium]|nr:sigma-70 family RNA polymerase sigma factor [Verrucomicrobiales bacterium]
MRSIKEVLRLRHQHHLSVREIARSCGLPVSTVGDYLKRAAAAEITWPLSDDLDEVQLQARLLTSASSEPSEGGAMGSYLNFLQLAGSVNGCQTLIFENSEAFPNRPSIFSTIWIHRQRRWAPG